MDVWHIETPLRQEFDEIVATLRSDKYPRWPEEEARAIAKKELLATVQRLINEL